MKNMLSIFGRFMYRVLGGATKTAATDTVRVTATTGLMFGTYYLYDKISNNNYGFFWKYPSQSKTLEKAPEKNINQKI